MHRQRYQYTHSSTVRVTINYRTVCHRAPIGDALDYVYESGISKGHVRYLHMYLHIRKRISRKNPLPGVNDSRGTDDETGDCTVHIYTVSWYETYGVNSESDHISPTPASPSGSACYL